MNNMTPEQAMEHLDGDGIMWRNGKRGHAIETETIRNGRKSWASYRLEGV